MSITISNDLQVHILSLGAGQAQSFKLLTPQNALEAFAILGKYIAPLQDSSRSTDKQHYRRVLEVIDYFNQREGDTSLSISSEISNWQALNLVTSIWDTFGIAILGSQEATSMDLTKRIRMEDSFLRPFNNYGIVSNSFFKGQQHFSITQGDLRKLSRSLGETLNEGIPSKNYRVGSLVET